MSDWRIIGLIIIVGLLSYVIYDYLIIKQRFDKENKERGDE